MMKEITILPSDRYGYDFISGELLPPGKDEYWLRNEHQAARLGADGLASRHPSPWRRLKAHELEILVKNENYCSDWNNFFVTDPFEPALVKNSAFYGLVRLGRLQDVLLKHHDFSVPAGIRNSTIISCDIGNDMAIQDCPYISHYIIGDICILSRIDEMQTTNHAKFGNGAIKDGESEDVRVWIDVMNEAGGRSILPFADMISADAFLWAAYRDDRELSERLTAITQEYYGGPRGAYGVIGNNTVIRSCAVIKDVTVGECAYIKGANKLKNLTILSSNEESTQIGEGVEMVNGIVGYGCHAFYGSKAVRFVMGRNSNLKYGARLIHSVLGDNSTVSCCELLNNLIFPIHEQHHNNSFLIAGLIQGMSNIAAGATIGSNHNSRANDGELRAGRGFWPGLSVTLKHSSRFASFVLISKGNYPHELNIPLPFSMVNNNINKNRLEVMPAYFWMHNLYALERNSRKAADRDRRKIKIQHIEMDYLAPDTAEEIINALSLLDAWIAEAGLSPADVQADTAQANVVRTIPANALERGKRGAVILKPLRARSAYRRMLHFYAMKTLALWFTDHRNTDFSEFISLMKNSNTTGTERVKDWVNMGGQIVPAFRVDELRKNIREGSIKTWEAIHGVYDEWHNQYGEDRVRHAWAVYCMFKKADIDTFKTELKAALETRRWITEQVYISRAKDFHDPFRRITYRNRAEMESVAGKAEENVFVLQAKTDGEAFAAMVQDLLDRI
ncbi:DUF4954 domain-containing protein [Spirochaetia bacterium]|nr:DUF4954 domain-containing protein [Spirochaetia bacterium]